MELTDGSQTPAIKGGAQIPPTFRLLPEIGALIGAVVALFVASIGGDFWDTLHRAFVGYLQRVGSIAGLAVPIGALAGFLVTLALRKKQVHKSPEPARWPRFVLTIWLSLAPALHWFAALFLLLYASRYTPAGGKIIPILLGAFHSLLLVLSISASVGIVRKSRFAGPVSLVYFALLTVALVLPTDIPAGALHLMPFMFWAPKPVLIAAALTLYVGLAISAVVVAKKHAAARRQGAVVSISQPSSLSQVVVAESIGFSLVALSLLAYFITSQFDSRPTTPITHCLLLALAASFMIAAISFDLQRAVAQSLLRVIAPGLIIVELTVLVALHHSDEADPVRIMMVAMGMIVILAPVAAFVPFRKSAERA